MSLFVIMFIIWCFLDMYLLLVAISGIAHTHNAEFFMAMLLLVLALYIGTSLIGGEIPFGLLANL